MFVSPSIFLKFSNFSLPSALVKMSAICSLVEQCINKMVLASTWCRIKWYFVLMCFVRSWNLELLANLITEVLSIKSGVAFTYFSYKSSSIFMSHIISFVASATMTYHASVMEFVGKNRLCDLQEIVVDPRLTRYPEVDTPFYLFPSKSKSIFPTNLNSSTLEYLSPKSWVPFKYLRILFPTYQCPSQDFYMNL